MHLQFSKYTGPLYLPDEYPVMQSCPDGLLVLYTEAPVYHNSKFECLFGACCDNAVLAVPRPHLVRLVLNLMYAMYAALPALQS